MSNGAVNMNGSALYTEIEQNCNHPEKHETSFYMMNHFLYSRLDSNYPTNTNIYDEDVNIYIANLLTSMSNSDYHQMVNKYVIPYDISLNKHLKGVKSCRDKYLYYRTNADFLFLSIGLFDNPRMRRPNAAPHMNLSHRGYIGRAKIYYRMAFSYLCKAARSTPAVAEVLDKLSCDLENYLKVLSVMKVEYLHLHRCMSEGEIFHFQRSVLDIDRESSLRQLYDRFLDLYSEYRRKRNPDLKRELESTVEKISALDPDFSFRID
ncbi:MAG: hypothetical protein GF417_00960 [Candidatus Latescibacteria bacterium]|nr:hypothetical protein [bacterium]MBD3422996.1 hypothetical protein [Candidatus Latescibacterota bacterium]